MEAIQNEIKSQQAKMEAMQNEKLNEIKSKQAKMEAI